MKVRFAVAPGLPAFGGSDLAELVDGLEDLGFDTIWLSDIPLGPAVDPFAGLAFAAGRTTRLKLGANIVPFGRTPFVLAKTLAQLDRLSAGRLLLSFVPGIDQPGERSALGIEGEDRGALLDRIVPVLRTWWAGGSVDGIELRTPPVQQPLEIWFGGMGPRALRRVGQLGDGWLGARLDPRDAEQARLTIESEAAAVGRTIDPEHFGLSLAYGRDRAAVRALVTDYVSAGVTKFVLRPTDAVTNWRDELTWLADAVLDLQT